MLSSNSEAPSIADKSSVSHRLWLSPIQLEFIVKDSDIIKKLKQE